MTLPDVHSFSKLEGVSSLFLTPSSERSRRSRRLLAHGCEVSFSVRVPSGDEVKAQLIVAALTLERVNMQLEQKGLSASLNFVGAPVIVRKI